jgi:hypothetical protein
MNTVTKKEFKLVYLLWLLPLLGGIALILIGLGFIAKLLWYCFMLGFNSVL